MSKPHVKATTQKPKIPANDANGKKKIPSSTRPTLAAKSRLTSKVVPPPPASKPKDDLTERRALNAQEKIQRNVTLTRQTSQTTTLRAKPQTTQLTPRATGTIKKKLVSQSSITTTGSPRTGPIKAQPPKAGQKANAVLDTYHNVTVASPPSKRKDLTVRNAALKEAKAKLVRKRSRTLEPEEIVVLKRESAKKRIEQEILETAQREQAQALKAPVKEAIAFEVNLKDAPTTSNRERSRTRPIAIAAAGDSDPGSYSDDFESYESDFETGSSSPTAGTASESESDSPETEQESSSTSESSKAKDSPADTDNDDDEDDEESELTQYPITVIPQRDKERKLDSGNYEMNSRKNPRLSEVSGPQATSQQQCDSFDTFSATTASDQLDSGISTYGVLAGPGDIASAQAEDMHDVFYGGYAEFNTRPILSRRGRELMAKIQFDTLRFTLLDMKPISYELFMRTYGQLNATQCSTQTQDNQMTTDCQTEACEMRTMWSQHPPQYDLQTVQKLSTPGSFANASNCCGEDCDIVEEPNNRSSHRTDELDDSLECLRSFQQSQKNAAMQREMRKLPKPIDFERLNAFLLNSSLLMAKVLNSSGSGNKKQSLDASEFSDFSEGYSLLDTKILNALRVVRVFANCEHNLIITVHESLPDADVYRSDFSQLLMVWSSQECNKPLRLLSTWSEVCGAEICHESADIIVCGLRDGSVAMWDLRETYSYCSKLDGHLTHFAATQSIVPHWGSAAIDLGAVVDVKSFRKPRKTTIPGYKPIQFASLNETGILVVWSLVETQRHSTTTLPQTRKHSASLTQPTRFEYNSPWARVKLIQSSICSVRDYLQCKVAKAQSQFDKTKCLFEKNIYSDEVLRELNDNQLLLQQRDGLQGLRFTSITTGVELIYVCTNRNYVICCTKSLKAERFRKIAIEESRFLFATALCVLSNEDFLAVGLSNGSVMILNCNQGKRQRLAFDVKDTSLAVPADNGQQSNEFNDSEYELETGKSCAIQNIILNERKSQKALQMPEPRPSTAAACLAMIGTNTRPFELHVYDHQVILSGSVLRKDLVQKLELSSDGWRLFALSNGCLRVYDFCMDKELALQTPEGDYKIFDIAAAKGRNAEHHILLLNAYNDVELHLLKP